MRSSKGRIRHLLTAALIVLALASILAMFAVAMRGAAVDPLDVLELQRRQALAGFVSAYNAWADGEAATSLHAFSAAQKRSWHETVGAFKRLEAAQKALGYE